MKQSLGSLLLFIIFSTLLYSEDFSYAFKIDKTNPYVKEPTILTLTIEQTNPKNVLFFDFDLKKSSDYTFQRVAIEEFGKNHFAKIKYTYLIYPLKAGEVNLNFRLQKQVTTDDSISYSYSGDRDNVKGLVTTNSNIDLEPIKIEVKSLPKDTQIVGDFKLSYHFKNHKADAYQAIPFNIKIEGHGFKPLLKNILGTDNNFTLFQDKPLVKSVSSIKGTENKILYSMAISNRKSFSLNRIVIKAFNPNTQKSYNLTLPKQDFTIKAIERSNLVDKEDYPKPLESDFSWLSNFFSYLIVFIAGYLTALSLKWRTRTNRVEENLLKTKIKKSKNAKELLQILMASNNPIYQKSIEELEEIIYKKAKYNFKEIKEEIL